MNREVIKNALGSLDKRLSSAKQALNQVESDIFNYGLRSPQSEAFEEPRAAMEQFLGELHDVLLVVLEAAEMLETRASLIEVWGRFTASGASLRDTHDDGQYEFSESPALTFLERMIEGLRVSLVGNMSSEEAWTLSKLEAMLEDTAALVHRRARPSKEADIQKTMHDYLSATFQDFRPNPTISGTLKNFKPDSGIANVGAAIEFKIVHTKEELAKAFSGIAEDTAAYKGSKDWTRFYAVIYQAKPFGTKAQFKSDMKRIGATEWKTILVNGPTKKKSTKKTAKKKQSKKKSV